MPTVLRNHITIVVRLALIKRDPHFKGQRISVVSGCVVTTAIRIKYRID
ncbi:hypothetical protein [Vibrio anguillarum]|nr:hypothetical protein [Vibrio anguillarum]